MKKPNKYKNNRNMGLRITRVPAILILESRNSAAWGLRYSPENGRVDNQNFVTIP